MPAPSDDPRFAFLRDPDLYDFMGRLGLKLTRDETEAEDVRNGAYTVAMQLVLAGKGPRVKAAERGWMCHVLKNHAHSEWRKKRGSAPPVDPEEMLEFPADDLRALMEEQREVERLFTVTQETLAKYPEHAREIAAVDGRKKGGTSKNAAERQRRSRARMFLASTISAALSAAMVLFLVRDRIQGPRIQKPDWTNSTLAAASREIALRRCAHSEWEPCLFGLSEAKRLDPGGDGDDRVQRARQQGIEALRVNALDACKAGRWQSCLDGLNVARTYDPEGDRVPLVQLARSEASGHVTLAPTISSDPNAKAPP
jgi:hypothetical protein